MQTGSSGTHIGWKSGQTTYVYMYLYGTNGGSVGGVAMDSAAERLCVIEPVLAHWANVKINYWHHYTIDAVQSFTFLTRSTVLKIVKNILCYFIKTSLLLCSMDGMWPKLVLTTHESCLWALAFHIIHFAHCTRVHRYRSFSERENVVTYKVRKEIEDVFRKYLFLCMAYCAILVWICVKKVSRSMVLYRNLNFSLLV